MMGWGASWRARTGHVPAVGGGVAVLLVAGVLAGTAVDSRRPTTILAGARVAPAGVTEVVAFDEVTTTTVAVTTSTSPRPNVALTSAPSSTTTTVRRPATNTSTIVPVAVTSTLPTTTVATTVPLPSRWSGSDRELSVSVRMEPATPVAGQPVHFSFEFSAYPGCCSASNILWGDGKNTPFGVDSGCVQPRPRQTTVSHTYAAPGAYPATLYMAVFPCPPPSGATESGVLLGSRPQHHHRGVRGRRPRARSSRLRRLSSRCTSRCRRAWPSARCSRPAGDRSLKVEAPAADTEWMSRVGGRWAARALGAALALLLPAAAWSAATLDSGDSTTIEANRRAGATGLGHADLLEEPAAPAVIVTLPALPTTAPAIPSTTSTTTKTTATTKVPTTTKPLGTGATTPTLPAGAPLPNFPPPGSIPNIAPASSWRIEHAGMSARMWMEPAAPVAGQPVRFTIEYSSAEPCCAVMVDFGDSGGGFWINGPRSCDQPSTLTAGSHRAVTTHTFAKAGVYRGMITVARETCLASPITSPTSPPMVQPDAASLMTCIAVGPGPAGQGCALFPPFPPGVPGSP